MLIHIFATIGVASTVMGAALVVVVAAAQSRDRKGAQFNERANADIDRAHQLGV